MVEEEQQEQEDTEEEVTDEETDGEDSEGDDDETHWGQDNNIMNEQREGASMVLLDLFDLGFDVAVWNVNGGGSSS
jgi:hypothetical protein